MKKVVASIAAGFIITGTAVTSVSAAEHEVKSGESLWGIANEYNTSVDEIVQINQLKSTVIHPKQVLDIDGEESGDSQDAYTVEKGDTLGKIRKQFGVEIGDLKQWNNLNSDLIVVGQELALNGNQVAEEAPQPVVQNVSNEPTENEANQEPKEPAQEETAQPQETTQEQPQEPVQEESQPEEQEDTQEQAEGETISVTATAYTADCAGCSGVTATGVDLNNDPNAKVIAVDPSVIPLGSEVYVEGYGHAIAADTGGAINGNKIDVHVPSKSEAMNWGNKSVNVTILD